MEAKVPQRIDMEDRVIGPLTLIQFFYLLFGGLFIYLLNSWTSGNSLRIFFYLLSPIAAMLPLALAFVKIQDRPFSVFLLSLISYATKPRQRVWMKGEHERKAMIVNKEEKKVEVPRKEFDRARVADLTRIVNSETPER